MRNLLLVAAALALAACGRTPSSLSMAAPDTAKGLPARAAESKPAAAAPAPTRPAPAPETLTDAAITEKIRTALIAEPGMAGADVSINIDRGVVSLAGTVKSLEQTGIASALAQKQDGVVRVDNQLRPVLS